jgi:hypothetical protein
MVDKFEIINAIERLQDTFQNNGLKRIVALVLVDTDEVRNLEALMPNVTYRSLNLSGQTTILGTQIIPQLRLF